MARSLLAVSIVGAVLAAVFVAVTVYAKDVNDGLDTVHGRVGFFEKIRDWWFGGGDNRKEPKEHTGGGRPDAELTGNPDEIESFDAADTDVGSSDDVGIDNRGRSDRPRDNRRGSDVFTDQSEHAQQDREKQEHDKQGRAKQRKEQFFGSTSGEAPPVRVKTNTVREPDFPLPLDRLLLRQNDIPRVEREQRRVLSAPPKTEIQLPRLISEPTHPLKEKFRSALFDSVAPAPVKTAIESPGKKSIAVERIVESPEEKLSTLCVGLETALKVVLPASAARVTRGVLCGGL